MRSPDQDGSQQGLGSMAGAGATALLNDSRGHPLHPLDQHEHIKSQTRAGRAQYDAIQAPPRRPFLAKQGARSAADKGSSLAKMGPALSRGHAQPPAAGASLTVAASGAAAQRRSTCREPDESDTPLQAPPLDRALGSSC